MMIKTILQFANKTTTVYLVISFLILIYRHLICVHLKRMLFTVNYSHQCLFRGRTQIHFSGHGRDIQVKLKLIIFKKSFNFKSENVSSDKSIKINVKNMSFEYILYLLLPKILYVILITYPSCKSDYILKV